MVMPDVTIITYEIMTRSILVCRDAFVTGVSFIIM